MGKKDFFLRRAFSRKAKDAPRQGQTVGKRTGSIVPGWIRAGIVAPFQHQFQKGSLMLEGASHLVIGPLVHANLKKLSRTSHMQGNLHVWFWPGFPEVSNNLASARRWHTSPNYCLFILE
ncbi:hypothetical protein Salat_2578600 [Sesamum alatum]|uniref:Uncharacterized protein n=1 Tax=Sesamum alatum TaxID=300844 RepID=A0AAE1XNL4_9LAMI|nr:hypothetical protein Salat_2578600 [Sesamum alatum]